MTKQFKSVGSLVLSWLLILQITIGSTIMTMPRAVAAPGKSSDQAQDALTEQLIKEGSKDPVTVAEREQAETFMSEVDNAGSQDFPQNTSDTFHLTGQTLEVTRGKNAGSYDLSSLKIDLPAVVADFDKEVKIETNRETKELSIVFQKGDAVVARHTIKGFDVVAFARDKEMLQFVDSSGKMYVMDMVFARGTAFKAPLPVFEVGSLPEKVQFPADSHMPYRDNPNDAGKLIEKVQVAFANRGIAPMTVIPDDAVVPRDVESKDIWTAGDFLVYFTNASGKRELIGVYSRGVSQMQMYTGNAVISFLATMVNPPEKNASIAASTAPLADPMVAAAAKDAAGDMDALVRDALAAFPQKAVDNLRARSAANKDRAKADRDRYEYQEWVKSFQALLEQAKKERDGMTAKQQLKNAERYAKLEEAIKSGDLSVDWQAMIKESLGDGKAERGLFYKVMTSKAMKYIAIFAGGALAIKGIGHFVGMDITPETARPLAWAVHTANWLYAHAWPEVLKNAAYRVTLFKSFFTLSMFIPALHVVGMVYGKAKGWSAMKAKATLGIRIYAAIQLPFWVRLARIAHQPNLMPSLQLGVNPFGKISKDSELGKKLGLTEDVRPGFTGFGGKVERANDIKTKRKVLEAVAVQKNRLRAYSFLLANVVVGEKYGIDPATMLMARGKKIADADVAKVLNDPKFASEWLTVAHELAGVLQDIKRGAVVPDVTELKMEQVLEDYQLAKQTAVEINSRGKLKAIATKLRTHWREFGSRFMKGFGRYGIEENDILKNVEPSQREVVEPAWQQFFMDYALAVFQMGLVGERADFSKPDKLAANPDGILYTNRGHFTDMVDQAVRAYGVQNPADLALVWQQDNQPTEDRYDPIEKITLEGAPRVDSFVNGMLTWTKSVLSLRQANYGGRYLKSLVKRFKTIQASVILSLGARLALAGQPFVQAVTGYGLLFFVSMPGYGWIWYPQMEGNARYTGGIDAAAKDFMEVKANLGQSLRLDEKQKIAENYDKLTALFSKGYRDDLPKDLQRGLRVAEEFLSIPPEQQLAELDAVNTFYGQTARLTQAMDSGDEKAIREAYEDLRKQYDGQTSELMTQLNARSLLEYALKHPPFATKAHPLITWTSTAVASVLTTLFATALFATSYGKEMSTAIFVDGIIFAAKFYGGWYVAQKLINKVAERIDYTRKYDQQVKETLSGKAPKEEPKKLAATYEEYRAQYIQDKANEYKVDPKDIESVMDKALEDSLKARYQAELKRSTCEVMLTSPEAVKPLTLGQKLKIWVTGVPKK